MTEQTKGQEAELSGEAEALGHNEGGSFCSLDTTVY